MSKEQLIEKIMQKKEFSQLPKKDVELVLEKFDNNKYLDEEKIKLSRDLLRKMYTAFVSPKLLNIKDKDEEWFLKKHISTKERFGFYSELYKRLLKNFEGEITVFDLGAGVNGFSYNYFKRDVNYVGVEAVGQLVDLTNLYFNTLKSTSKNKINAKAIHESLFELEKIKKIIKKERGKKIIFLFKTLDSLEMLERDYSKKLLKEIVPLAEKVVISFATRSLIVRKKFNAKRRWLTNFIEEKFNILDNFELGSEHYIVFCKK
ncbi:MAG: hypothetical protein ABFQ65_03135 [Nanoarchaeota archaeon]